MRKEAKQIPDINFPSSEESYDLYARYYDISTNWFEQDLPLYKGILALRQPPFIEIGCGTGRVLESLLGSKPDGFTEHYLTGVDISDSMLEICKDKTRKYVDDGALRLLNHDLSVNPLTDELFNAALVTFYTMNYIPEDLQLSFLMNIKQAMQQDGSIALDLFYPPLKRDPGKAGVTIDHEPILLDGKVVSFQERSEFVSPTNEQRDWIFTEPDGQTRNITMHRYYISPKAGRLLLESVGFVDVQHVLNYNLDSLGNFDEDFSLYSFALIARKP